VCLFAACFACVSGAAAALNDYPFRVDTVRVGAVEQVVARNDGPAPITIHVALSSENMATTADWPVTAIVPAHGTLPLAYIAPVESDQPYRYLFSYTYYVGRIDAAPSAEALYRYPFGNGEAHAITQAHGGDLTSHNNKQNRYAVDFDMPVGTPVVAARAGVVVDVVLTHESGGRDVSFIEQANMITIVHDDGTLAEYAHLSPGNPLVSRGERVAAGTLIGYSGNTGYSTGPHLHFVVSRPDVDRGKVIRLSLPIQFYADDSRAAVPPRTGTLAVADYHPGAADRDIPPVAGRGSIEEAPLAAHPLTAQGSTDRQ
jgi:murein DD-endopeptidase MepM/ murein hydrolase activator NlpD